MLDAGGRVGLAGQALQGIGDGSVDGIGDCVSIADKFSRIGFM
jgi:hypothetical protein